MTRFFSVSIRATRVYPCAILNRTRINTDDTGFHGFCPCQPVNPARIRVLFSHGRVADVGAISPTFWGPGAAVSDYPLTAHPCRLIHTPVRSLISQRALKAVSRTQGCSSFRASRKA